ncbi:hypothetical protein A3860_36555 [Niastella vici]|uniref:DUF4397 domain-containing protein n=1 Tax=Niastella vici TaxID=1703345 RepID=A0A1V9FMV0_9BACT|nr:hypothetical protein [Niastella vici]OQP59684.1 hypothetical protein A3860_36555 [Niastella vici]
MRNFIHSIISGCIFITLATFFFSCKKDAIPVRPVASLTVTNAIVGSVSFRVGNIVLPIFIYDYAQLSIIAGESDLYVWPAGDSAHPYFQQPKFYAENRGVYSVFLAGQAPNNVTGIVLQDNIPYHTDSTCGVRIINCSPNSQPLNITLSTSPMVNEVSNLTYLQHTDFKLYPAKAANTSYVFQVRNAADNTLLGSIALQTPRFANVTLVIKGMFGTSSFGIFRVRNDR